MRSWSPRRSPLSDRTQSTPRAAFAAGEQDSYWQYAALLFENQGAENRGYVTDEFLTRQAVEVEGLDMGRWQRERKKSYDEELASVQQRADEVGVNSTPTLVVSGPGGEATIRGAVSIEDVDRAVEEVGG